MHSYPTVHATDPEHQAEVFAKPFHGQLMSPSQSHPVEVFAKPFHGQIMSNQMFPVLSPGMMMSPNPMFTVLSPPEMMVSPRSTFTVFSPDTR